MENEIREVKRYELPASYDGRCSGDQKCLESALTVGGKLPKGEVLRKFVIKLPIPSMESMDSFERDCDDFFGMTPEQLVKKAVGKIMTDIDGQIKDVLFDGCEKGAVPDVSEEQHLAGQKIADEWRWEEKKSKSQKVNVSTMVQRLVAAGIIPKELEQEIKTDADLAAVLKA